jgi:NADH-quinone oxidoreductase subunit C
MFGVHGTGDTSGFGGLELPGYVPAPAERPYGGWFDAFVDELGAALAERGIEGAVQQITIDRGEITFYVAPERLLDLCRTLRDDEALRFELCSSVSGVDYGADVTRRLHVVYHLLSMTYRRRIRLEVALDVDDAHVPSVVELYPTADWHERETWDMFGGLRRPPGTDRILMPDDWDSCPQRKDYPLGGIPVEYKARRSHPDQRRRTHRYRDDRARPAEERITAGPSTVTGGDWDAFWTTSTTTGSSSTWARSTRRRTACCGSCWS